jgi:hypothetical protein
MQHYILYHTDTGFIETVLRLTETSKQKMLDNNPNIAFMPGKVADVNKVRMNISGDSHYIEAKPENVEDVATHIRQQRLTLLKLTDWTQTADSPLSDSKKAEWATYRQALRDLPDSADNWATIQDITWPTQPS